MENVNSCTHVPPGFRFHPTDEELVDYYLRRKINSQRIDLNVIKEVDLYKIEPWDLQEICRMGDEEQNEWYFFSHKDKKYPTGTRTNRATAAGFWKATGRDKAIYSKHSLIGMRKTLVFYKGRAPNGQKSDCIMHEYRLETDPNGAPQEEGWVVCRMFKKRNPTMRNTRTEENSSSWYDSPVSFMMDLESSKQTSLSNNLHPNLSLLSCKKELDHHQLHSQNPQEHLIHMPPLDNSKVLHPSYEFSNALISCGSMQQLLHDSNIYNGAMITDDGLDALDDQMTDWRVLDKFVASQLSQEEAPNGSSNNYSSSTIVSELLTAPLSDEYSTKDESMLDNTSTSTSSSQNEVWKST